VRPTTKPTRGGNPTASTSLSRARCTTTEPQPARRPRRTAVAKSSRRVNRVAAGNNGTDPRNASGRQLRTALAAPGRDDRTARAGAHAQPEPVGPRAATVVRLERALALTHGCHSPGAGCWVLGWRLRGRSRRDCVVSPPYRHRWHFCATTSPGQRTKSAVGEGTQECPPVGGRRPELRRPVAVPSKRTSRVTVGATRRYIGGACLHGVLVAAPQAC